MYDRLGMGRGLVGLLVTVAAFFGVLVSFAIMGAATGKAIGISALFMALVGLFHVWALAGDDASLDRRLVETEGEWKAHKERFGRDLPAQPADGHECAWCGNPATISRKYKDFDLVFPVCSDAECHGALDRFLGNSACFDLVAGWMNKASLLHSMGIPQEMKQPEFVRRIERLRKYVRMQRP